VIRTPRIIIVAQSVVILFKIYYKIKF